jgi:two-component system, cell cycle sensor histidine kinase and response regulator CckA
LVYFGQLLMKFHKNEYDVMKNKSLEKIPLRILYLEDSPRDIEMIQELLEDADYALSMDCTAKKKEFHSMLLHKEYDVILSDFKLPGFDAFGALELSKKNCSETPFICISGSIGEDIAIELIKKGAVDYVLKDRMARLPLAIKRAIDEAKEKKSLKNAEEALKESEKKFQVLAENSPVGIFQTDAKGATIYVNPKWCQISGLSEEEALGTGWLSAVHEDDKKNLISGWKKAMQTHDASKADYRFVRKDGSIAWVIGQAVPEKDNKNKIIGYVGTITEITERRRIEEALVREQFLTDMLMENVPDNIYFKDRDSRFLRISNNHAKKFCLENPEQAVGKTDFDFFTKEHAQLAFNDEQTIMKSGKPMVGIEEKETMPDGHVTWVSTTKMPLRDKKGHVIGTFGISRDISERKRAEEELLFTNIILSTQMETSIDGIIVVDENLAIISYNHRFVTMWGIPQELIEQKTDKPVLELVSSKVKDPRSFIQKVEYLYKHKSETSHDEILLKDERIFDRYSAPMIGPKGRYYGRVWYFRDITDRKRAEEALRKSEEKYRNLIDNIKEGIFISDEQGVIQFANKELARIHGYENPDELKNKKFTEFIEHLVREKIEHQIRTTTDEMQMVMQEFPIVKSDGSLAYVNVRPSPIFEGGRFIGTMGIVQDVTERKQTEEALRTSEEKFRKAFITSPDSININRLFNGMFVSINNGFTRLMEYTEEDVLGKTSIETGIWYDLAERDKLLAGLKNDGVVSNYEARFRTKSGKLKYGLMSACLIELDKIPHILSITRDITERRFVEEALQMSEKKYRSIFENVQDVYYETLMDGTIVEVSPSVKIISKGQYKRADVIGKSMNEFYPDADARHALMERLLQTGSVTDFEILLKNRDGSMIPCSISSKIYFDNQGRPERIIGSMRDVTMRKQAEDKLRESQVLYHSLVEELPAGVFRKDIEGKYVFVSPWFCRLKEMTEEEFLGKTPGEVAAYEEAKQNGTDLTIKYAAEGERNHKIILQTGKTIELDEEYLKFDGTTQYIHSIKMPLVDSDGKIIGSQGVLFDITELKRAEEDVRKLSSAVEQSGSSVMITNLRGDIEYVNKKFVDVTGYSIQEVLGKNPNLLKSGHTLPEEYKVAWDTITKGEVWRGEFHNKKKNGELFWELATISPIRDSKGIVTHFIAVKEDITQQKIIEEQLRQVQKLEGLGTLAGGIAHDFNNILGIILAFITSIKRFKNDEKKLDVAIDTIMIAVQRGKKLVQQILTFARKTETEFDPLNVNDVIMEIMTMIMETFPKILTYSHNCEKSIPFINADHSQLHQALLNLCVNARDAMPKGGVLTINSRMLSGRDLKNQHPDAPDGSYVCIEVCDTGDGMSPETRNRIFEPFFTTKGVGKGTGLGLAVVYGVVQTHKGYIDVDSKLGKGTTFRLFLPAMQTAAPVSEKVEETLEQIKGGTETLLVVEDEEMLIMSLEMVLIEKGYTVLLAGDGLKALQLYQENKKDIRLVITDYGLPNLTGIEVCQRIKQINPNEHLIVATGYLDPDMKTELQKTGVEKILYKPYDIKEVLKSVREVLDGKNK